MSHPLVSVITPTYARAETLPRLYESLLHQGLHEFEWVVIDDGSRDGTADLVSGWAREAPFSVQYRWQENRGRHVAVNRGVELAKCDFCALMDSDDWYAPEALERMVACWKSIPATQREKFANVEGLCADRDGRLLGDRFPADVFDSNTFEIQYLHGISGDTVGMYRRDVLRAHPFPEDLGWHVRPGLVWNRIAAKWSTRFVNEIWGYKEYLEGGLTERGAELRLRLTEAQLVYWSEFAAMPRRMSRINRLRANANRVRYSLWQKMPMRRAMGELVTPGWAAAAAPLGVALYWRDRLRKRQSDGAER